MAQDEGGKEQRPERREEGAYEPFRDRRETARGGLILGTILVSVGIILLIDNFYPGFGFSRLWPAIIIVWGFAVIVSGFIPPFDFLKPLKGILIGTIGTILLYNTLGILSYRFWLELIPFWPVLAGVTRSRIVAALPTLIIIATLIFTFVYGGSAFRLGTEPSSAAESRPMIPGVTNGEATVDFTVGELDMGATDKLYDVRAREFGDERLPTIQFSQSGDSVGVAFRARNDIRLFRRDEQRKWNVLLSRDVDWRLNVKTGVSDSDLDLSGLKVSALEVDGGVGSTRVRLGDKQDQLNANIKTGVSELRILVPKSSGVRVGLNRGLSTVDFRNIDVERTTEDNRALYETPGFSSASKKLNLDVSIGVSSFIVEGY